MRDKHAEVKVFIWKNYLISFYRKKLNKTLLVLASVSYYMADA